jgi:hypothetical protein
MIVIVGVDTTASLAGDVIVTTGGVVSTLAVASATAVFPALSLAVPLTV